MTGRKRAGWSRLAFLAVYLWLEAPLWGVLVVADRAQLSLAVVALLSPDAYVIAICIATWSATWVGSLEGWPPFGGGGGTMLCSLVDCPMDGATSYLLIVRFREI